MPVAYANVRRMPLHPPSPAHCPIHPPTITERVFTQTFPATRQGARLARLRASDALAGWDLPPGSAPSDTVASVVAELANNAVLHGHVPGRDFALTLTHRAPADGPRGEDAPYSVLVEVADTRAEAVPPSAVPRAPGPDAESGRGLLLVAALAADWGVRGRDAAPPGKTVWARCDFRPGHRPAPNGTCVTTAERGTRRA